MIDGWMRATRCRMGGDGRLLAIVLRPCGLSLIMRLRGDVSWAGYCLGRIIWEGEARQVSFESNMCYSCVIDGAWSGFQNKSSLRHEEAIIIVSTRRSVGGCRVGAYFFDLQVAADCLFSAADQAPRG